MSELLWTHFTDEETESWRDEVTCPSAFKQVLLGLYGVCLEKGQQRSVGWKDWEGGLGWAGVNIQ